MAKDGVQTVNNVSTLGVQDSPAIQAYRRKLFKNILQVCEDLLAEQNAAYTDASAQTEADEMVFSHEGFDGSMNRFEHYGILQSIVIRECERLRSASMRYEWDDHTYGWCDAYDVDYDTPERRAAYDLFHDIKDRYGDFNAFIDDVEQRFMKYAYGRLFKQKFDAAGMRIALNANTADHG